ncbi:hypothetical protein EON83_23755 [bacterium]|nr:MAG: hypothetical protein EON83_23755 [bacterium]
MNSKPDKPSAWETAVLAGSFLAVWGWYLSRQSIYKAGLQPSIWHSAPLVIVVLLLGWVFVRRLRRVVTAMREQKIGLSKPRPKS